MRDDAKRFRRLATVLMLAMVSLAACSPSDAGRDRTPVILIVIDTLRTDVLGCYGADRSATPGLDALAKESVLFEAAYSQAPWTLPSFASLFTSTYPTEHGALGKREKKNFFPIRDGLVTAAEALRSQGYRTGAIVNNIFLKGDFGFEKGFDTYDFFPATVTKTRAADEVTGLGQRWIKEHARSGDPYFLLLHYFDPHFTYKPPRAFAKKYGGAITEPIKKIAHPDDVRTGKVKLNPWDQDSLRNLYEGEVAFTDNEVGRLLGWLREENLFNKAVVIVTSDHGEEFWDHGDFEHGHTQYDELVKVPLLIRFPAGKHAGRVVKTPVRLMDLMPTLFESAGMESPATFRGKSFLSAIEGAGKASKDPLLFEGCLYGTEKKALRVERLKLIRDVETGETALYDLASDPGEQKDIAAERPGETKVMKETLEKLLEGLKAGSGHADQAVDLPPEMMEALRKLGYAK
ncbi:MAG: sulfatase [Planctomycetota bacterium]|jgi:arylsulfatase A-like enzyme